MKSARRYLSVVIVAAIAFTALADGGGFHPAWAQQPELDGTRPLTDPLVCLARTIYFEAGGQSTTEMAAVGHVVMNRVKDSQFPPDVCSVVREGGETAPCQFSWWCDGRSDVPANRTEYDRVVGVARDVLEGKLADPTNGANMFHNRSVSPHWAKIAELRGRIGDQLFYFLENR